MPDSLSEFEVSLHMGPTLRVHAATKEAAVEEFMKASGVIDSDHPFQVVAVTRTVTPVTEVPQETSETPEPTDSKELSGKSVMRIHEYASEKGLETSVVTAAAKDMNFDSFHPSSGLTETEIQLLDEYLTAK